MFIGVKNKFRKTREQTPVKHWFILISFVFLNYLWRIWTKHRIILWTAGLPIVLFHFIFNFKVRYLPLLFKPHARPPHADRVVSHWVRTICGYSYNLKKRREISVWFAKAIIPLAIIGVAAQITNFESNI